MLIKGDWVRLTRDVLDGATWVLEGTKCEVLDAPDASGFLTLVDGGWRRRVPEGAVEEIPKPKRLIPWGDEVLP